MNKQVITVYVGKWNEREFTAALSYLEAKSRIERSYAYGDSEEGEKFPIGNTWATDLNEDGWRIVPLTVEVPVIPVEIKGDYKIETAHLIWQCPDCMKYFSEDWESDDKLPILLCCSCRDSRKFFLGTAAG